jgi:hypothetical protein
VTITDALGLPDHGAGIEGAFQIFLLSILADGDLRVLKP